MVLMNELVPQDDDRQETPGPLGWLYVCSLQFPHDDAFQSTQLQIKTDS